MHAATLAVSDGCTTKSLPVQLGRSTATGIPWPVRGDPSDIVRTRGVFVRINPRLIQFFMRGHCTDQLSAAAVAAAAGAAED